MKKTTIIAMAIAFMACGKQDDLVQPISQSVEVKAQYLDGINTMRIFRINGEWMPSSSTQTATTGDVIEVRNQNHMGGIVGAGVVVDGVVVDYVECECPIVMTYVIP